jgi:hypothetical protein
MTSMALIVAPTSLVAQTAADSAGIRSAAEDYVIGWYDGDVARMERAVHPDLAKRDVRTPSGAPATVRNMTAATLLDATRSRATQRQPDDRRLMEITILTIHNNVAAARVDSWDFVDLVHLGRLDGRWVIINDLWTRRQ